MQVGGKERERRALTDALDHPPQRLDVAELRRPAQPVLTGTSLGAKLQDFCNGTRFRATCSPSGLVAI